MAEASEAGTRTDADLDNWFSFIGYGDPNAPVWFIGIEEGGDQDKIDSENKHLDWTFEAETLTYDDLPEGRNQVWDTARKLMEEASAPGVPATYFLSNIAPLPRTSVDVKHSGLNEEEYTERIIKERVGRLYRVAQGPAAPILVFHGIGARGTYRVVEEFGLVEDAIRSPETGLLIAESPRLIFAPSFSRGSALLKVNQRAEVVAKLKAWMND